MKTKMFVIVAFALTIQAGNAQATTLLVGDWNSSTTLDYAVGSTAPTVNTGTAITTGSGGRFGEGLDLDNSSDRLTYSGASNFDQNRGTISFWFKNAYNDMTNNGPAKRLVDVQTAGGTRLVDIHWNGSAFDNYTAAAPGGAPSGRGGYPPLQGDTTNWHYIAYEWDAALGISKLWEGSTVEGTATCNTNYTLGSWTPSGAAATIHVGHWNTDDDPTRAIFDNLVIADTLLYDHTLDTITLPNAPLGVPEPGTLVLLATAMIGLVCYAWRKRK